MNKKDMSLSSEAYHKHPALSRSAITAVKGCKTAAHYHVKKDKPRNKTPLKFGHAFHCALLEPKLYERNAVLYSGKTKGADTKAFEKEEEALEGEEFLVHPLWEEAFKEMAKSIDNHKIASDLLSLGGDIEASFFWTEEVTFEDDDGKEFTKKLDFKCRPDLIANNVIVDLKKINNAKDSAHQDDFIKHAFDYGYHVQAYMNMRGIEIVTGKKPEGFVFLVVEDEAPHGIMCHIAGDAFLEAGELAFNIYLKKYLKYEQSKECYKEELNILEPQEWQIKNLYKEMV